MGLADAFYSYIFSKIKRAGSVFVGTSLADPSLKVRFCTFSRYFLLKSVCAWKPNSEAHQELSMDVET